MLLLPKTVLYLPKNLDFSKNADISKVYDTPKLWSIFSEITYVSVLTYQFQVSWIILKSSRQMG